MPSIADLLKDNRPILTLIGELRPGQLSDRRRCNLNSADKRFKKAVLLKRDGDLCWVCSTPFTLLRPPTIDHVVELRQGGSDALINLKLAHSTCNNDRSNRVDKSFRRDIA